MRNKLTGMMMLAIAALGLVACSDKLDEPANGHDGNESYVYMNVAVTLPSPSSTTRSATDDPTNPGNGDTNSDANPDFEYGYDYESEVKQMLLVIASEDDKFVTSEVIKSGIAPKPTTNQKYGFTVGQKFSRSAILAAYDNTIKPNSNGKYPVHVYVFCNPTEELINKIEGTAVGQDAWLHYTSQFISSTKESIWGEGTFLMSNADKAQNVIFPDKDGGWDAYTTETNPFPLSTVDAPIYVERTVARFDYRAHADASNSIYNISSMNSGSEELINVELLEMTLVNMSKEYHYLRRVSATGTATGWTVGGLEWGNKTAETGNYVVDTDWEAKSGDDITVDNANTYFHYPLYIKSDNKLGYEYNIKNLPDDSKIEINSLLNGKEDNWSGSTTNKYHIWRYVTENTIPGIENQKHIQSTGIVFKAKITAGKDLLSSENVSDDVKNALTGTGNTHPTLYLYSNTLYAGFDKLVQQAQVEAPTGSLYRALTSVFAHWYCNSEGKYVYQEEIEDAESPKYAAMLTVDKYVAASNTNAVAGIETTPEFKKLFADEKVVTAYQYETNGYYCYYFYWNRHNDNGNNSKMGIMEFATVRNNVYKLSVSTISQLGHPTDPTDDPDPVDPDDPDEDDNVYMSVTVEVLPWVVRENDIKF